MEGVVYNVKIDSELMTWFYLYLNYTLLFPFHLSFLILIWTKIIKAEMELMKENKIQLKLIEHNEDNVHGLLFIYFIWFNCSFFLSRLCSYYTVHYFSFIWLVISRNREIETTKIIPFKYRRNKDSFPSSLIHRSYFYLSGVLLRE